MCYFEVNKFNFIAQKVIVIKWANNIISVSGNGGGGEGVGVTISDNDGDDGGGGGGGDSDDECVVFLGLPLYVADCFFFAKR